MWLYIRVFSEFPKPNVAVDTCCWSSDLEKYVLEMCHEDKEVFLWTLVFHSRQNLSHMQLIFHHNHEEPSVSYAVLIVSSFFYFPENICKWSYL